MFAFLRILFVLFVVGWAWCLWQEKRTGEPRWRTARSWLWRAAMAVVAVIVVGLFVQRLVG